MNSRFLLVVPLLCLCAWSSEKEVKLSDGRVLRGEVLGEEDGQLLVAFKAGNATAKPGEWPGRRHQRESHNLSCRSGFWQLPAIHPRARLAPRARQRRPGSGAARRTAESRAAGSALATIRVAERFGPSD